MRNWQTAEPIVADMIAVACEQYNTDMFLGWDVSERARPRADSPPAKVLFRMTQGDGDFEAISDVMFRLVSEEAADIDDIELVGSTSELARCKQSPLIRDLAAYGYVDMFDNCLCGGIRERRHKHEAQENVGFTKSWWTSSRGLNNGGNDFELVVRMTKELEYLLETHFGAPAEPHVGLRHKIESARKGRRKKPFSTEVQERMFELVKMRNNLVHKRDCNQIPDKGAFLAAWREVEAELNKYLPRHEEIRWNRIISDSRYDSVPFAFEPWRAEVARGVVNVAGVQSRGR